MKVKHHVFYVPGILDDIYHLQSVLVATWRLYGVRAHCHPMPWAGTEPYELKFNKLLAAIDDQLDKGNVVSLVGASAGASAVINAYVERADRINGVVYVCGKINGPETVSKKTYKENPAFKTSLAELQTSLSKLSARDKSKMLSLYSDKDNSVPYEATTVPGVDEQQLPGLNHGQSIIYSLSLGAPVITRFLKKQVAGAV